MAQGPGQSASRAYSAWSGRQLDRAREGAAQDDQQRPAGDERTIWAARIAPGDHVWLGNFRQPTARRHLRDLK
jgi:hypothetical protein